MIYINEFFQALVINKSLRILTNGITYLDTGNIAGTTSTFSHTEIYTLYYKHIKD